MNKKTKTGSSVWLVEARWENTRESVTEARYFTVETVAGTLADAKGRAQEYLYRRVDRASPSLEWLAGTDPRQRAEYARHAAITFRITEG